MTNLKRHKLTKISSELLAHFSYKNMEALVKVVKSTLEKVRRRIVSPTLQRYKG